MKKEVKCNFKNLSQDIKEKLKTSHCLLLVSVGQESHEGERFEATIDLINDSFQSCSISLYDSLQRYSMALSSSCAPEYFYEEANTVGDFWIKRNSISIEKLKNLKSIYRWDNWINHPNFLSYKAMITKLIETDYTYKLSFDSAIDAYLERYTKHIIEYASFDENRARKLCFEYVLEECVVLCLWPELHCQFEVYPSLHNDAIEATRERFITNHYPGVLYPLSLRFRNAKQLKAQNFWLGNLDERIIQNLI